MEPLRNVHPAAVAARQAFHAPIVEEVARTVATNPVVIVGMAWNPVVKRARALLDERKVPYVYLEYGNYLSKWRERLAIKLWSGWPTFPQVFVHGALLGGHDDTKKLVDSGEFDRLLSAGRATGT